MISVFEKPGLISFVCATQKTMIGDKKILKAASTVRASPTLVFSILHDGWSFNTGVLF